MRIFTAYDSHLGTFMSFVACKMNGKLKKNFNVSVTLFYIFMFSTHVVATGSNNIELFKSIDKVKGKVIPLKPIGILFQRLLLP